jgi:hypothetical protein
MGNLGAVKQDMWFLKGLEAYPEYSASNQGHDAFVTKVFVEGFDGHVAHMGDLVFIVYEEALDQAIGLP